MQTEKSRTPHVRQLLRSTSFKIFVFMSVDMAVVMRLNHHFRDLTLAHILFVSTFTAAVVAVYTVRWRTRHPPD